METEKTHYPSLDLHQSMLTFDCVFLVDCNLSSAAERRLYALLDAHARHAVGTAVIVLNKGKPGHSWLRSARARQRMQDGQFTWLDPEIHARAKLVLILSQSFASFGRSRPLRLRADQAMIWPIEPALDAASDRPEILADQGRRMAALLDAPVVWAARSEEEYQFLAKHLTGIEMADDIWWPLIASEAVRTDPSLPQARRIGRHWTDKHLSERARDEWRDACFEPWGGDLTLALRGGKDLFSGLPPSVPEQMVRHEDNGFRKLDEFLADLDLFLALGEGHVPWRIDEEIQEAMAAGLVVIAPPSTSKRFDGCLPSAEACFLGDLAVRLLSDDQARDEVRSDQAQLFSERYGESSYHRRLISVLSSKGTTPSIVWAERTQRSGRVLFISDDSRYLEHLSRQLAIAKYLPVSLKPYFLTMARDASLVEQAGFPVEYLLGHSSKIYRETFDQIDAWNRRSTTNGQSQQETALTWNRYFARHVHELIAFLEVKAIVFDGMFPFAGLAEVHSRHPTLPFAWIRRGLWQADADDGGLSRSGLFDLVIEPHDCAGAFDRGPTKTYRDNTISSDVIRLGKMQASTRARDELGIAEGQLAVYLQPTVPGDQIGGEALSELLGALSNAGCRFWTSDLYHGAPRLCWPVEAINLDRAAAVRKLGAFDLVISGADYRSVHDAVFARCPSVLVPDQNKAVDDQITRAGMAARDGWALILSSGNVYSARSIAKRFLDPEARAMMTALLPEQSDDDGSEQAAWAIAEMVYALNLNPPRGREQLLAGAERALGVG